MVALISLLYVYLLSSGNPSLGFPNPWPYGDGLAGLNEPRTITPMGSLLSADGIMCVCRVSPFFDVG